MIDREIKRAQRLLKKLPFIRFAAITGSYAKGTQTKDSDIDLFLVAQSGRIFTARFFANLFFSLFKLRVDENHNVRRFCLNYWLTDKNMLISPQTAAIAAEYSKMVPIYVEGSILEQIVAANKEVWERFGCHMKNHNILRAEREVCRVNSSHYVRIVKHLLEFLLPHFLEPILKKLQIMWLKRKVKDTGRLKLTDTELMIHF